MCQPIEEMCGGGVVFLPKRVVQCGILWQCTGLIRLLLRGIIGNLVRLGGQMCQGPWTGMHP